MLLTAMHDLGKRGKVRKLALEYFTNSDDSYPFSFLSVCETLCIEPESVLRKLGLDEESPRAMPQESSVRHINSLRHSN